MDDHGVRDGAAMRRRQRLLVVATRAAVSLCSPRHCPPPLQLRPQGEDEGGGVRGQRGGRERDVLRPTGTEDPASGDAAGASV